MRSRMANFTNYQEGKATKLMLETQQRTVGSKSADADVDGSVREPPSPIINISGGGGGSGGGGFRSHQLPPSYHHHLESYHYELASHHHLHHLSADVAESPGKKLSSPVEHSSSTTTTTTTSGGLAYETGGLSNPPDAVDDIRKCGYLRKQKHGHKRFFVLRASSHLGPSRLEYYDNEKKFRSTLRGGAGPVGPNSPKRVIYLYQCFTVNKRADSKNKHLIALYTKDEYFAIVAESEQDQEDWYVAISELMNEGRKGHLITDDLDDGYGTVTPGTVFKEVWHVNVKPKGLGQTKNLTGLYRLCLSSKTLHLIKLNSETPCVNQHLMNIRRCGNSESFFFIEVGRFSSIGPGEIWMQVDDSVVAQKMHETLLNTMKALKAYVEVRPRSKSQSSGSNPMPFVTTHRHLSNLPPSQTGPQRRSRLESVVGTPPSSKSSGASGYRFRTSSEGEGTMSRLFRSTTGSPVHLNSGRPHLGRADGDQVAAGNAGGGRHVRAVPGSSASNYHARSASLPVSHPFATSPASMSSSSGHGSVSDTLTRPSSASICGSPSDGGFNSSDEYGSSPGDFRYFRVRSNTPDSLGNTPPIREENCLSDYMAVGWNRDAFGAGAGSGSNSGANTPRDESTSTTEDERFFSHRRRRSAGPGVAVYQKMTQTNFASEEGADASGSSCSEHSRQNRSSTSLSSAKEDGGYVPMLYGVAPSPRDTPPDYVPMHPSFHAVPQPHQFQSPTLGPRSAKPQSQSAADAHGYMMMLPGCRGSSPSPVQASLGPRAAAAASGSDGIAERPANAGYMDMSCAGGTGQKSEGGGASHGADARRSFSPYFSLPRSYKAPTRESDGKECDDYVPMASLAKAVHSSVATASLSTPERGGGGGCTSTPSHPPPPYGAHHTTAAAGDGRVVRPNRLPLGRRSFHGLPRVSEPSAPSALTSTSAPTAGPSTGRPSSPGEYINVDFGDHYPRQQQPPAYVLSANDEAPALASGDHRRTPPLPQTSQDYMSMEVGRDHQDSDGCLDKSQSPRPSLVAPWNPPSYIRPLASNPAALASPGVHAGGHWRSAGDDYTNMMYGRKGERTPASPTDMLQHLCVMEGCYGHGSPSIPPTLPPRSPARASPHPLEPKVVRADPQGRRRHSSETFSSTSSSTSTPSGGPSSATHLTPVDPSTSNGSHAPEVQAPSCAGLASFDSVWMSVESRGDLPVDRAPVGSSDPGVATGALAPSSTPTGRMYGSNTSVGYQNGLNYIALEVRDVGSCADATPATGVAESSAMPENGAYASLDKSDAVSMTTED